MTLILDQGDRPESPMSTHASIGNTHPRRSLWSTLLGPREQAPAKCPWGAIADANEIAPGIIWFATAARSGCRLSARRQRMLPRALRTEDRWYENQSEWAAVGVVFDRIFERIPAADASSRSQYQFAKETLKHWRPAEYARWFQTELDEAEIRDLAITHFPRQHGDPDDYLRRTLARARATFPFPPSGGAV